MAHVLPFRDLLEITAGVGVHLRRGESSDANLYVIVDRLGNDLYVGKAGSGRRHDDEDRWAELDHTRSILSGFVALWHENDAERVRIQYDPGSFNPSAALSVMDDQGWSGGAIEAARARLRDGPCPAVEEVERLLVRIHIRAGRLIGNSQFASQWESPIGSYTDTLAVLAVDRARGMGLLPTVPPPNHDDPADDQLELTLMEEESAAEDDPPHA